MTLSSRSGLVSVMAGGRAADRRPVSCCASSRFRRSSRAVVRSSGVVVIATSSPIAATPVTMAGVGSSVASRRMTLRPASMVCQR